MDIIQIGSFTILLKWFLLGVAILFGIVLIKVLLLRLPNREENKAVFDLLTNSVFLGFFIWKGSLLLTEPSLVIKSPLSLLYFTGGRSGLILAIIFSIYYFIYKARKLDISMLVTLKYGLLFSFSVLSVYHFLSATFVEDNFIYHVLIGIYSLTNLILILVKKILSSYKSFFSVIVLFSFFKIILSMGLINESTVFIFSMEQWFFVGLIILSLYFWDRKLQ